MDDLREDRVRPHLMPNLSALMQEAVYFSSAYAQGTWTVPSHASLFLSQYTATHDAGGDVGRLDFRAPREGPYLAGLLRERGYRTALYANSMYFEPEFRLARGIERNLVLNPAVDPLPPAADWLAATSSATFLFLHTYAVHNFPDIQDSPNRDASGAWRCPPVIDPYKTETLLRWKKRQRLTCEQSRQNYDRAAYCFDAAFGAFVARLKASGLWDRALVAVVADHGEGLCDGPAGPKTRQGHGALGYEEQLHVPWLLKLPGALHGGRWTFRSSSSTSPRPSSRRWASRFLLRSRGATACPRPAAPPGTPARPSSPRPTTASPRAPRAGSCSGAGTAATSSTTSPAIPARPVRWPRASPNACAGSRRCCASTRPSSAAPGNSPCAPAAAKSSRSG